MLNTAALSAAELNALVARLGLVDPTDPGAITAKRPAARLKALAGKRIALLENRKPNAAELLQALGALLVDRGGAAVADSRSKFIYSRPAAPDIMDELSEYDAVVTAIGD
jgi:hypothetical protein